MPVILGFSPNPLSACFLFPIIIWLTYWDILRGKWVSDDIAGIWLTPDNRGPYTGKLQKPLSWHNIFKKLRFELGKMPNPDKDWQRKKLPPFLSNPVAHHRLNLWIFCGVSVLLYLFLLRVLGNPVAFLATLLFTVHPLGCQTVGWISGIGYVISTFFMLLGFNVAFLVTDLGWLHTPLGVVGALGLYGFIQWMAVEAHFATIGAALILAWLQMWPFAIVAGILACMQGFQTLKSALDLRFRTFKEQAMGHSTQFRWRKLLVCLKTLYYDTRMAVFPKRIGLYHTFHYHYELPYAEAEDQTLWAGVAIFVAGIVGFFIGPPAIQLGLLWFLAFMMIFLNLVTANQFVVDRYVWLPSFGVCVLAAALLPLWAVLILFGIALMRTWAHIPTYFDELFFYQSNIWNFPDSEVAYGNLGVAQFQRGLVASSFDSWLVSTSINPEFDVPWYNLSSHIRARGVPPLSYYPVLYQMLPPNTWESISKEPTIAHLQLGRMLLEKALSCRQCHFREMWQKELTNLNREIHAFRSPPPPPQLVRPLMELT